MSEIEKAWYLLWRWISDDDDIIDLHIHTMRWLDGNIPCNCDNELPPCKACYFVAEDEHGSRSE